MVGQSAHGIWASIEDDVYSWAATVQVNNRNTFAEVALSRVNDISVGDGVLGQIGITQVVSNEAGVENFFPVRQGVYRKGVTSVTYEVLVMNSFARGRLFLNYWS